MKLKKYNKCKDCPSCDTLYSPGRYYCRLKMNEPFNAQMDISTCEVDPESKPEVCQWDKLSETFETFSKEDQLGMKFLAKMFGGNIDWFEEEKPKVKKKRAKVGKWICICSTQHWQYNWEHYKCSVCDCTNDCATFYCPNCGAKMNKIEDKEENSK